MAARASVIIPTFNSGSYVKEAVASALAQTFRDVEIIVVDDGSTDGTEKVLAPYVASGKIKYLKKENGGPASARNLGIAASHGEFVAFLDADDVWLPEKLERQMPLFDDSEVGLVYSDTEIFGAPFSFKSHSEFSQFARGHVYEKLVNGNFVPTSSVIIRREVLQKVGGFDEDHNVFAVEDYLLWLMLAPHCKFDFVPEELIQYRIHADQISKRKAESYRRLRCLYAKVLAKNGFDPRVFKKYLENGIKFIAAKILRM